MRRAPTDSVDTRSLIRMPCAPTTLAPADTSTASLPAGELMTTRSAVRTNGKPPTPRTASKAVFSKGHRYPSGGRRRRGDVRRVRGERGHHPIVLADHGRDRRPGVGSTVTEVDG